MSLVVTIAQAIADAINGSDPAVAPGTTARRAFVEPRGLDELVDLAITVVPDHLAVHPRDLTPRHQYDWNVAVWIQKRTDGSNDQNDPLMGLHQAIIELFRPWWARTDLRLVRLESRPTLQPDVQDEKGLFETVVQLTIRSTI